MKKHALIVAGGLPPTKKLLKEYIKQADFVIAADSGADALVNVSIKDLTLVGDFDSIAQDVLGTYKSKGVKIFTSDTHKDETDTLLAVNIAIERGAKRITILGALGKRLDHQYANIALLLYAKAKGAKAELIDETTHVFLNNKKVEFAVSAGDHVSVFSVSKRCVFKSSKGLAYPLNNLTITRENPVGVSNKALGGKVYIHQKKGTALVMITQ